MHASNSKTLGFFVTAIAFIWIMQAPAVLAKLGILAADPQPYGGLTALGLFSPLIAATAWAWREARGGGVRELYAQLLQWRASPAWYVAALLVPPLLLAAGMGVAGRGPYFLPPDRAARWIALFLVPFVEELGWRGYALPRLLVRHRPVTASLIVGVCWWAWHAGMFIMQDYGALHFTLALLLLTSGSIVYTWLYLRSGGGLTIAVVAHASAHLSNSNIALPADSLPFIVQTASFGLAALLIVLIDRSALGSRRAQLVDDLADRLGVEARR